MAWPAWGTRAVAAGGSVLAGAVSGMVTNVVSDRPTLPWIVALAVLVALMAGLQVLLTVLDHRGSASPPGAGAVSVGGSSSGSIRTDVDGVRRVPGRRTSSGAGSVQIGGDSRALIRTRVRDVEEG
ncbi:hypothetical protein [Candidatus Frankia alpina]|uniref:hypothetical protein n=1 Tax=Candidatus Frankia alpina TaxID=2699483 RepID=UPI001386A073|nr:hypothetical protein [Candidatus Frankia alpina]